MKKSKGEKIDLLYSRRNENINTKIKKRKKTKVTKVPNKQDNKINTQNEIIVGVTTPKVEIKKTLKKNKIKKDKSKKDISQKKTTNKTKENKKTKNNFKKESKNNQLKSKKDKIKLKIMKWTTLIIFIMTATIIFMLSSVFNIKEIIVINNNKVSKEEVISLSGIIKETNIFKIRNGTIKESIRKNSYIEDVAVKRSLNGKITLNVKERVATYMLKFANAYVYINNQGYMLEISNEKLELPIITGFTTPVENIELGNRLITEDLEKLQVLIKITEEAKSKEIQNLITSIDIIDSSNYTLVLESELKTVHFGNSSNISQKMLYIKALIEQEKNIEGEIFLQNINKIYFREKVSF